MPKEICNLIYNKLSILPGALASFRIRPIFTQPPCTNQLSVQLCPPLALLKTATCPTAQTLLAFNTVGLEVERLDLGEGTTPIQMWRRGRRRKVTHTHTAFKIVRNRCMRVVAVGSGPMQTQRGETNSGSRKHNVPCDRGAMEVAQWRADAGWSYRP